MIRQVLQLKGIFLSNKQFEEVMEIATKDIKFNNISFSKKSSLEEVIAIAERASKVIKQIA